VLDAIATPAFVGAEHEFGIGPGPEARPLLREGGAEFLPVVDASVHHKHEVAVLA
jgi:hypothetical protein